MDTAELADLIEQAVIDAMEQGFAELARYHITPALTGDALSPYRASIRPWAQAFAAGLATGETEQQLTDRLAAIKQEPVDVEAILASLPEKDRTRSPDVLS